MKRVLLLRWNPQQLRGVVTFPWAASRVWSCGTLRPFQEQGEVLGEILGLIAGITQRHDRLLARPLCRFRQNAPVAGRKQRRSNVMYISCSWVPVPK